MNLKFLENVALNNKLEQIFTTLYFTIWLQAIEITKNCNFENSSM